MKWLNKLRGLDFPAPEVGQFWECGFNGRRIKVVAVTVSDLGQVFTDVIYQTPKGEWSMMPTTYSYSLGEWRRALCRERRKRVFDAAELARFGFKPSDYEGR